MHGLFSIIDGDYNLQNQFLVRDVIWFNSLSVLQFNSMQVIYSSISIHEQCYTPSLCRAHNSFPHKWYCHFWDWHNWYLTLLIKLKLILVNIGTLNYWYWAQFTLTLLKLDISDLQNDWHLQVLMFGIIGISCFWFLELFIFSMSDIKHDWYMTWLTLAYLIFGISGIEHYQKLGVAVIIYYWFMMP